MKLPVARNCDISSHGGSFQTPERGVRVEGYFPVCATDIHVCKMVSPSGSPHPAIPLSGGCPTVLVQGLPILLQQDLVNCIDSPCTISTGSCTVWIGSHQQISPNNPHSSSPIHSLSTSEDNNKSVKTMVSKELSNSTLTDLRYVLST
jgi:uncharacterized Zn-binding protein involved in type VI secretion